MNDELIAVRYRHNIDFVQTHTSTRHFYRCSADVERQLFLYFCTCLSTGELWTRYKQGTFKRTRVQYRNCYRTLFGLPRECSASQLFVCGKSRASLWVHSQDENGFPTLSCLCIVKLYTRCQDYNSVLYNMYYVRWMDLVHQPT